MMRQNKLSDEANKFTLKKTQFLKFTLTNVTNRDFNIWTNVNEVGSKNVYTHTNQMHGLGYLLCSIRGNRKSSISQSSKYII